MAASIGKLVNGATLPSAITGLMVVTKVTAEYFGSHAKTHNAAGEVNGTDAAGERGVRVTISGETASLSAMVRPNDTISINLADGDGAQNFIVESCKPDSDITGEEVDSVEVTAVKYHVTPAAP